MTNDIDILAKTSLDCPSYILIIDVILTIFPIYFSAFVVYIKKMMTF